MKKRLIVIVLLLFVLLSFCACRRSKNKTITLNFVSNNEQPIPPVTYTKGKWVDLPADLQKEGYDFEGWFVDVECNQPFLFENETDGMVLYAKWTPKELSVEFYYFEGKTKTEDYLYGDTIKLPVDTEREDFNFAGWYTDEELTASFVGGKIVSNLRLYAAWSPKVYHWIKIIDWDDTLLFHGEIEEGHTLDEKMLEGTLLDKLSALGVFHTFSINGSQIDIATFAFCEPAELRVEYEYPISEANMFQFFDQTNDYAIGGSAELKGEVFLPPTYKGKPVTTIPAATNKDGGAFSSSQITAVYIPPSYAIIGTYAFYGCENLTDLVFLENVKPTAAHLLYLQDYAFYGSGINFALLPERTLQLGNGVFLDCLNLQEVYLPSTLQSIGEAVFRNCVALQSIDVAQSNKVFASREGNLISKDGKAFICYAVANSREEFSIYQDVESISAYAFFGAYNLHRIELSWAANLKSIGSYAFYASVRLEKIDIPDQVTSIGDFSFSHCYRLVNANLSEHSQLASIGDQAFSDCEMLEEFYIPSDAELFATEGLASEARVFVRCPSLKEIRTSPNSRYYSSIDGVLYSKDVTDLLIYPAGKTSLRYEIESSVTRIKSYSVYSNIYLKELVLGQGLLCIDQYSFAYSKIEKIVFPSTLLCISAFAFAYCDSLESVEFAEGSQIETLETFSFLGCFKLKSFIITASYPPLAPDGTSNFFGSLSLYTDLNIYVPMDATSDYKNLWSLYAEIIYPIQNQY